MHDCIHIHIVASVLLTACCHGNMCYILRCLGPSGQQPLPATRDASLGIVVPTAQYVYAGVASISPLMVVGLLNWVP